MCAAPLIGVAVAACRRHYRFCRRRLADVLFLRLFLALLGGDELAQTVFALFHALLQVLLALLETCDLLFALFALVAETLEYGRLGAESEHAADALVHAHVARHRLELCFGQLRVLYLPLELLDL